MTYRENAHRHADFVLFYSKIFSSQLDFHSFGIKINFTKDYLIVFEKMLIKGKKTKEGNRIWFYSSINAGGEKIGLLFILRVTEYFHRENDVYESIHQ